MKLSKRNSIIFALSVLFILSYILLSESEKFLPVDIEKNNTTSVTISAESKIQYKPPVSASNLAKTCSTDAILALDKAAVDKWKKFKKDIYSQQIRYQVLQLAIQRVPPLRDKGILKKKPTNFADSISETNQIIQSSYQAMSAENQKTFISTLLTKGVRGIIIKIEDDELPEKILLGSRNGLISELISISSNTKNNNFLPSKIELTTLLHYGNEITINDYIQATKAMLPLDFLELLIEFGPSPDENNYKYQTLPLDVAAKQGNFELMEFWLEKGLIHTNKLYGGNFSDALLLQTSNNEDFQKSWQFIQQWNQFPRSPSTAKALLSRNYLLHTDSIKFGLEKLAKEKWARVSLNNNDENLLQQAIEKISIINIHIQKMLDPLEHCLKKPVKNLQKLMISNDWVNRQLNLDISIEDILLDLSKQSPFSVDRFRSKRQKGDYMPRLAPLAPNSNELLNSNTLKAVALIMGKDWKNLIELTSNNKITDAGLLQLVARSEDELPYDIKLSLLDSVRTIPVQNFREAASLLNVSQLENLNIDGASLTEIDPIGKNLFYYAVSANNTEMMQWLFEQQINMDPDPYGSDPMDAALRWNRQPATLSVLCSFDFPIKQKHIDRLAGIKKKRPVEAEVIFANCPQFKK